MLALLDPDADLTERLLASGRAVVQLLTWDHRDLAEMFAGTAPAPGGMFRQAEFVDHRVGPAAGDGEHVGRRTGGVGAAGRLVDPGDHGRRAPRGR